MMNTFKSIITYKSNNGDVIKIEHDGFNNVKDATRWMWEKVGYFVLHWGEINENGMIVYADVCTDMASCNSEFCCFCDSYEIRCGM